VTREYFDENLVQPSFGGVEHSIIIGRPAAAEQGLQDLHLLSVHTAPAIHYHVRCAVPRVRNLEHFYDHVRIAIY
jgi:hypothetical protein